MSRASMGIYAERARVLADPLVASARYVEQRQAERRIVLDVARKLDIQPDDRLLDIGAGIGTLTIPLSYMVASTVAIDHEDCLLRLRQRAGEAEIATMPGDFLELHMGALFSAILAYDVIHYLADSADVLRFVTKAIGLLDEGGRMLIGDLPNAALRRRFISTAYGREFEARWRAVGHDDGSADLTLTEDDELVPVDDALVRDIMYRASEVGCRATRLSQDSRLPFGWVREDVLIRRL